MYPWIILPTNLVKTCMTDIYITKWSLILKYLDFVLLRSSKSAERNISYNSATALKGSKQRDRVKQRERERREGDSGSGEAITKSILSNKEFLRS